MKKKVMALALAMTMMIGTSLTAAAAPEVEDTLTGQGFLSDQEEEGSGGMIDVSISEDSFLWYANESTKTASNTYAIKSAEYKIINHSERVNLRVSLDSYEQSGALNELAAYENAIKLNLKGDLIDSVNSSIGQDLFNSGDNYKGTYDSLLEKDSTWKFSFGGEFTGTLPTDEKVSDYALVLRYEAVSLD